MWTCQQERLCGQLGAPVGTVEQPGWETVLAQLVFPGARSAMVGILSLDWSEATMV